MSEVKSWSGTAASNNSASPDGFPEGMAPSGVNDSAREVMAAIARYRADTDGVASSTGSANAYVLASATTYTAYTQGDRFCFKANFANTGAATLNVDGVGAKTIKRTSGIDLVSGDIPSGAIVDVVYDGTNFELVSDTVLNINGLTAATAIADADKFVLFENAGSVNKSVAGSVLKAAGACVLITSGSASAAASVTFTGLSTTYHAYLLVIHDCLLATSGADLWIQTSTDNGSSYQSGATDYRHIRTGSSVTGSPGTSGSNTDTKIVIANGLGNSAASGHELKGRIFIHDPGDANDQTAFEYQVGYLPAGGNFTHYSGYGIRSASEASNAFRLIASSGNITTCTYALYGFKA